MYELFGFSRTAAGDQIELFVPDNVVDPTQYIRGGSPTLDAAILLFTIREIAGGNGTRRRMGLTGGV